MGKVEDGATLVPSEHLPLLGKAAPSSPYLSQEEVAEQGSAAPWPGLRKALLGLLAALFGCMLALAAVLLLSLPQLRPPLGWWQKAAFYHLPPSSFPDSNGDGWGDLAGVRQELDQLVALSIQALVLGPILAGRGANLSQIVPAHGSLAQLQALANDGRKRGIRILLELPTWEEEMDVAAAEGNQTAQRLKGALEFWQSEGVYGFLVAKDPAWRLDTVLDAWSTLASQMDPQEERPLIVWDKETTTCSTSHKMPSRVVLTCHLPGAQKNLSAQTLLQLVPRGLPPVGSLGKVLGVLLFTLPGVPLVQGGARSPLPLEYELMEGKARRAPLAVLYQSLLALHARSFSLHNTDFALVPVPSHAEDVFAFLRPGSCSSLLVILNLGPQPCQLSLKELSLPGRAKVVLSTHPEPQKGTSVEMVRLVAQQALLLQVPGGYQV